MVLVTLGVLPFMYPAEKENILLILHKLQQKSVNCYLSKEDLLFVSNYLGLNLGLVYGVATYYSMFSLIPRGKYVIKLCKSPVCHMLGSTLLLNYLCDILQIKNGDTTKDGLFTIETVECLGHCDKAPCVFVNDNLHGNLTKARIKNIITFYENKF